MRRTPIAFTEGNLAVMGLYDVVYDLYSMLRAIYSASIEQQDASKTLWSQNVDVACRAQVRQVLDDFLSRHTSFFSGDYKKLHINGYGLNGFSLLNSKHGERPLHIIISFITFRSFLEELFMVVVRVIAQRRNRENPSNAVDGVFEDVNQYIDSLTTQYRKRIAVTSTNKKVSEDNHLFIYSQFSLISCNQKKHTIVPDKFCAEKLDGTGFYNLPIHRCGTCGRKFVGKYTLGFYQKEFGKIRVAVQKDLITDSPSSFEDLKTESQLHSHSYNVIEGQMSETERRNLLIQLLQSGKMTYFEISRDIKNAIHTQQHLPFRTPAVAKWKSDLEFLSKYIEDHDRFK